jgi:trimeric autotransporter adhesin
LGFAAGGAVTTASSTICIGTDGQNVSNSCYIGQIFGATAAGGIAVFVNSDGKLGTVVSSRRFKEEIQPMEQASESLFALKPVTFCYKEEIDPAGTSQFGLVAEDVERVNPDLIVRDKDGKAFSVRYDQVNAMLLNEFLKEHRDVADLKSIVAEQRKSMEAMAAQLKAQASQIQKVSAQLETSQPAPQVVKNNQ